MIKLVKTCNACPEQYDAYDEYGGLIGYLRLRWGHFSVRYPNPSGEVVYEASPRGDGIFEWDERDRYLADAVRALALAASGGGRRSVEIAMGAAPEYEIEDRS